MKLSKLFLVLFLLLSSVNVFSKAYIDTEKYKYKSGESISIQLEKLNQNKDYWLGVYEKSSANNWKNVVSWPVDAIKMGPVEVESIKISGKYEARLFYKNTYKVVDTVEFDVVGDAKADCGTPWYSASLTNYTSYPEPNSEECLKYNGCKWAGQFYGLDKKQSKKWVRENNIVAVHMKDWSWLGSKKLRIRNENKKSIVATVYDACADSDCEDCCTKNLGDNDFLIDIEKYSKKRFGAGSGTVEFQVCD